MEVLQPLSRSPFAAQQAAGQQSEQCVVQVVFRTRTNGHPGLLELERTEECGWFGQMSWDEQGVGVKHALDGVQYDEKTRRLEVQYQKQRFSGVVNGRGQLSGSVRAEGSAEAYVWNGVQLRSSGRVREAWRVTANGYHALLELEQRAGEACVGRLTFDKLGCAESLVDVVYGDKNGMIHFKRRKGKQVFDGMVVMGKLSGSFTANNKRFPWYAFRVDGNGTDIKKELTVRIPQAKRSAKVSFVSKGGEHHAYCNARILEEGAQESKELQDAYFNPHNGRLHFKNNKHIYDGVEMANGKIVGTVQVGDHSYVWEA